MTTPIAFRSAAEIVRLIRSRDLSPLDVMEETLKRIREVNPPLNAFVSLRADEALEEARAMTEDLAAGKDAGVLAGIPIGVKDLEDVKDMVTSFGSVPFKNHRVAGDSTQVARLRQAGAIVVGKTIRVGTVQYPRTVPKDDNCARKLKDGSHSD